MLFDKDNQLDAERIYMMTSMVMLFLGSVVLGGVAILCCLVLNG